MARSFSPPYFSPGTAVTLRGVGSRVHWALPATVVQDTEDFLAVYVQAGAAGKNIDHRPAPQELLSPEKLILADFRWTMTDVLMLIFPGDAFCTYAMWKTGTKELTCWYINLQEPVCRSPFGFDTQDHLLDVVVKPDMSGWKWKDLDEFEEAARSGFYSPEKARAIRAEGERAVRLVLGERKEFYRSWQDWQPDVEWGLPELSPEWDRL